MELTEDDIKQLESLPPSFATVDDDDEDMPFSEGISPNWSPRVNYDLLCESIIGQDEAKKAAAMVMYNTWSVRPCTALFCGQSGSGKTEIWRVFARALSGLINIIDGSHITPPGYRGSSLASVLYVIQQSTEGHPSILVIDEVDKMLRGDFGVEKSAQLLKLLEHEKLIMQPEGNRPAFVFDASNVSIVLLGAFTELRKQKLQLAPQLGFGTPPARPKPSEKITEQDLINYGISPEIVGRIERIVTMEQPTLDMYARIAELEAEKLTRSTKRTVSLSDYTLKKIVADAYNHQVGARYLKNSIYSLLDEQMFDHPSLRSYTL